MPSKKQPNLIYIFADQWRRQAVGFKNEDPVMTPNIDQFANESLNIENAVSGCPLCSPARASLLTGRYPMSTGVYTNCKTGANIMLSPDENCISDVLKSAGYSTGYIGKWHLDLSELNVSDNPSSGAKGWDAYTPPGPKRHGFDYWYSYGADDNHMSPHYWIDSPEKINVDKWSVEHETDVAIDFLENQDENNPFALFLSWNPPHSPFDQVPEQYKQMYANKEMLHRPNVQADHLSVHTGEDVEGGYTALNEKMKNYFAAITGIDENFSRIMEALKQKGLEEDTIVVLSADHGEMMGSHGLMAKHVWYEESIGIPFMIRWPEQIPSGNSNMLLNTVDIMPTLLQLLNLKVPETVEGTDQSSKILKGEDTILDDAFLCAYPGRKVLIDEFQKKGINNLKYGWRGIRTLRYTYIVNRGYSPEGHLERLLYDNDNDPYQLNPLRIKDITAFPDANHLEEQLKSYLEETKDPFEFN